MTKYQLLRDLTDAMSNETERAVTAYLDNDVVTFIGGDDPDDDLLDLHPTELQEQALSILGIAVEHV